MWLSSNKTKNDVRVQFQILMKLFISHSSKNRNYGDALLSLLTEIGVPHTGITYTSNTAYGIPVGENIFDWLKSRLDEKPLVLFLISNEYYASVACLNEMGAAWVVGSKHIAIFTPHFDLDKPEFRNGALDPRNMGFYINDEDRVTEFTRVILDSFQLNTSPIIVNKAIRSFTLKVERTTPLKVENENLDQSEIKPESSPSKSGQLIAKYNPNNALEKFMEDMKRGKLPDEDILILSYIIDTGRYKLGVGWKSSEEVNKIQAWESVHNLRNLLSNGYDNSISRIEFRKLASTSDYTNNGNPKEVTLTEEMCDFLINLPDEVETIMKQVAKLHENFDLPF